MAALLVLTGWLAALLHERVAGWLAGCRSDIPTAFFFWGVTFFLGRNQGSVQITGAFPTKGACGCLTDCLAGWLALAGWLPGGLAAWLSGWLAG